MSMLSRDIIASSGLLESGNSAIFDSHTGVFSDPIANRLHVKGEPIIKSEMLDGDLQRQAISKLEEAEVEDLDFGDAEGLLASHEEATYYLDGEFKIKQVPPAGVVRRTIGDFAKMFDSPYLRLNPEYQRAVVWDDNRASGLIASLFQGYFIPPIIFSVETRYVENRDGTMRKQCYRTCVDGKQRLTSVQKFMAGQIGVYDSCIPPRKWYYKEPVDIDASSSRNFKILPETTKKFFRERDFCVYEYEGLSEAVEENMFQLVQRGVPLTPAERMRALSTEWANFAKQYEEDYPRIVSLSKQARASGFRAIVTIFAQILEVKSLMDDPESVGLTPALQSNPQALTKLLLSSGSLNEAVKAQLKDVFDTYQQLVDICSQKSVNSKGGYKIIKNSAFDPSPRFLEDKKVDHVKTFSPLELLATAILVLQYVSSRTRDMLMDDIKNMRYYLRENHRDLRINNQCWTTAWKFIDQELITYQRERAVQEALEVIDDSEPESSSIANSTPQPRKRPRK